MQKKSKKSSFTPKYKIINAAHLQKSPNLTTVIFFKLESEFAIQSLLHQTKFTLSLRGGKNSRFKIQGSRFL